MAVVVPWRCVGLAAEPLSLLPSLTFLPPSYRGPGLLWVWLAGCGVDDRSFLLSIKARTRTYRVRTEQGTTRLLLCEC